MDMTRLRLAKSAAIAIVLAGVYFAAAKLGLRLAFVNANATAVWPPTGIALAGLLLGKTAISYLRLKSEVFGGVALVFIGITLALENL